MAAYADTTKLAQVGIIGGALANVSSLAQQEALEFRSRFIDSYLATAGYTVPIVAPASPGEAIAGAACILAAYDCITARGYNPASAADQNIRMRYLDILEWLKQIAIGALSPGVTGDTGSATANVPQVESSESRGWTPRDLVI